jgi:hypothetical protein
MAGGLSRPVLEARRPVRVLLVILLIVGCGRGKQEQERTGLDQRARDSIIGGSTLPGTRE